MYIRPFKVEKWMNEHEDNAIYNMGETCISSLTVGELLELVGEDPDSYLAGLKDTRLSYGHIFGSPRLLEGIASLYRGVSAGDVILTHGAIGANYQVICSLLESRDNMVSVMPTYQQHYSIPESLGVEVRPLRLLPENNFLPDLDELARITDKKTKLITINNPNNPSGSWIPPDMLKDIVAIAKKADAYVLSDEVYRGIWEDGSYMESILDFYEKGISVGSFSKVFSLAGLRLGWIASKDAVVREACLDRRDYDTISCGVLNDHFAALALKHKEKIFARNHVIVANNRVALDEWVRRTPQVHYVKPVAGTTALIYYEGDIPSEQLAMRLMQEKGVLVVPGACFELEGCMRIGYAYDSEKLCKGLDLISEMLGTR